MEEPLQPGDDEDDDRPAPETGLGAIGQLAAAVLMVAALVAALLAIVLVWGWIFH